MIQIKPNGKIHETAGVPVSGKQIVAAMEGALW
jgi:hypothetical protein